MPTAYKDQRYRKERARILADSPLCVHCRERIATEADHQPPLSMHMHEAGSDCCVLVPSCAQCGRRQGGVLRDAQRARAVIVADPVAVPDELVEPAGFGVESDVWDVPWLEALRDVPPNATWPRLMTVPHPLAVGSLGVEACEFALVRRGRPWRWWQQLVATRLLEVDADGLLLWEVALLTVARQVGKTWWLADVCGWRQE